jgi:hypothetical protein
MKFRALKNFFKETDSQIENSYTAQRFYRTISCSKKICKYKSPNHHITALFPDSAFPQEMLPSRHLCYDDTTSILRARAAAAPSESGAECPH